MFSGLRHALENPLVVVGVSLAIAALVAAAIVLWRRRKSPGEIERLRRAALHRSGRLLDGMLTDVRDDALFFTYTVRGIEYQAAQDVSALRDRIPADTHRMLGPVTVKYMSANPANSIVLCEEWSGLHSLDSSRARPDSKTR